MLLCEAVAAVFTLAALSPGMAQVAQRKGRDRLWPRIQEKWDPTLFAALDVATGWVKAGHYRRRKRRQFLSFMNELVAEYPDQEIHVVLDNLNTHKPKTDRLPAPTRQAGRLPRHPNVHFYYTPTHVSWLNQIEIWFSILWRGALKGSSFTSIRDLRSAIDHFIDAYNENARPFEWKATKIRQKPSSPG